MAPMKMKLTSAGSPRLDKISSPWSRRRQVVPPLHVESVGSAPSSPQTASRMPKLTFWKRGSKALKSNPESFSGANSYQGNCESLESESPLPQLGILDTSRESEREYLKITGNVDCENTQCSFHEEELRTENSLKIRIQEAKGIQDNKSYLCVLLINGRDVRETTVKHKEGICFWGEQFEFIHLENVNRIGIRLEREDGKRVGSGEFEPSVTIQCPKLDEWVKLNLEVPQKEKEKEPSAVRIRYTFRKITILPLTEYKRFVKYLRENSIVLCQKLEHLLNAKSKEELLTSLIVILSYNNKAVSFLSQLIMNDVQQIGDNQENIFRANSMATKAIEAFMKLTTQDYLRHTLKVGIEEIINTEKDFEVDCTRIRSNAPPLEERRRNLLAAVNDTWMHIVMSPKYFPAQIQEVFFAVGEKLNNPELTNRLVSASVFLRLLCPAIMNPHLFGLVKEYPDPAANRRLTLVAKTLQTLANLSSFQSKEACMQFLNSFIDRERDKCLHLLSSLSGPRYKEDTVQISIPKILVGRHLALLHLYIKDFLSSSDIKTSDGEIRQLMIQISHIDDCLLRHERLASIKQQENLSKISTPFIFRSPSNLRRNTNASTENKKISSSQSRSSRKLEGQFKNIELSPSRDQGSFDDGVQRNTSRNFTLDNSRPSSAISNMHTFNNNIANFYRDKFEDNGCSNSRNSSDNPECLSNIKSNSLQFERDSHYQVENCNDHEIDERNYVRLRNYYLSNDHGNAYHERPMNNFLPTSNCDSENNNGESLFTNGCHSPAGSYNFAKQSDLYMNQDLVASYISPNVKKYHRVRPCPSSSPISTSSSSGVLVASQPCSPHDSPVRVKMLPHSKNLLSSTSKIYRCQSTIEESASAPTPHITPKRSSFPANRVCREPPDLLRQAATECHRRQTRHSPSSSDSSSPSPTSRTRRRRHSVINGPDAWRPRTNPHCSPIKFNHWKNSPARKSLKESLRSAIDQMPDIEQETALCNQQMHQEDHMQAILDRLITMEVEMRCEQEVLLQEMSARDQLLREQQRHIAALDSANFKLIKTIASLTATQTTSNPDREETAMNVRTAEKQEENTDFSTDSGTGSDMSGDKTSTY